MLFRWLSLLRLIDNGTISGKIAKDIFEEMLEKGGNPKAIVEAKGLVQISDAAKLKPIIDKIIMNNPQNVAKYKEGRTNLPWILCRAGNERNGRQS